MLNERINQLIEYGLTNGLLNEDDRYYALNRLSQVFNQGFVSEKHSLDIEYDKMMDDILKEAHRLSLIKTKSLVERDAFEARLMDCLLARPTELNQGFRKFYKKSPQQATRFYYDYSVKSKYVKNKRNDLNILYNYPSHYGDLDILIHLAKPKEFLGRVHEDETYKDLYPACELCMGNVGLYQYKNEIPMTNHRVVNITVDNEKNKWGLFYQAYALVPEHFMVIKKEHQPMNMTNKTFSELIDFINKFPHYTVGCDADLKIIGGTNLSHYHFQGGKFDFPIEKANAKAFYKKNRVKIELLDWPVAAIKLSANNENKILDKMEDIYKVWKDYANEDIMIKPKSDDSQHNSLTIMVKLDGSNFNVYMIFRNNATNLEYPKGIFHTHPSRSHIKDDYLGLFDVLGMGILPGNLHEEVNLIKDVLLNNQSIDLYPQLKKHGQWIKSLQEDDYDGHIDDYLKMEIGKVFENILKDANVFKFGTDEDFISMIEKAI